MNQAIRNGVSYRHIVGHVHVRVFPNLIDLVLITRNVNIRMLIPNLISTDNSRDLPFLYFHEPLPKQERISSILLRIDVLQRVEIIGDLNLLNS